MKDFGMTSCSLIVTLNMSDSSVVWFYVFKHQNPCSPLRVLGVSGVNPTRINSFLPDKVSLNGTRLVSG